ncbi:MAG: thiamine phosphate synthase [Bacteroidota bacterium]
MTLANLDRRQKRGGRLPRLILVTDEVRLADPLPAMRRLPPGAGVLLRHYGVAGRPALARQLAQVARRRRLVLLVAGADWRLAAAVGAAGVHLPEALARQLADPGLRLWQRRGHVLSIACHDRVALARARAQGADAAVLSPVFPTASHPGAPVLGAIRFALWAGGAGLPVVALGGVNRHTAKALRHAAGMAAIGGFSV